MIRGQEWLRGSFVAACCTLAASVPAQAQGTSVSGSQVAVGSGAASTSGATSTASTVAAGRRWTYASGAENWIGRDVALGDHGTQVFVEPGSAYSTRLLSAHDANPPSPLWTVLDGPLEYDHVVDSAEEADLHLSLYQVALSGGLRRVEVRRFDAAGPGPIYVHPVQTNSHDNASVRVTPDGTRAVVPVWDIFSGRTVTVVLDTATMTEVRTLNLNTSGFFRAFEISDDARVGYFASSTAVRAFDLTSGEQLLNSYPPGGAMFNAHALSGDGRYLAYGGYGKVRVFRRDATGQYQLAFEHLLAGANYCDQLAISADGSTLAAGYDFYDQFRRVDVEILDLATQALTARESIVGGGQLQNMIADLDLSKDGSIVAAGLWGDELGSVNQVRVYRRDQDQPIGTWGVPGSVMALDLSPDGARLAVASKAVHAAQFGTGGSVDLFDTRAFDIDVSGAPHPGTTMRFELRGPANSPAWLFVSDGMAPRPLDLALVGDLYLRRGGLQRVFAGTTDSQGRAFVSFALPAGSTGHEFYFQGFTTTPRRLTADWTKLAVGP